MRNSCLLILTIVWPLARSFDVSWLNVPNDDDVYRGENRGENEIPPPNIRPDKPSKPGYHIWTEDLYEANRVCSKIYCNEQPCCHGECIYFFGSKLCIEMGRRKK